MNDLTLPLNTRRYIKTLTISEDGRTVVNPEADKVSNMIKTLAKLKMIGDYFMTVQQYVDNGRRTWTLKIYD